MEQNEMRKKYRGGGRIKLYNWIKYSTFTLVCLVVILWYPIGILAEVGTSVDKWEIELNNEDVDTNQAKPTGMLQCEFLEYQRTDPDTGGLQEGLALKLTVPDGDYTITPTMMEDISNRALDKGKKIYSMIIEGAPNAQIVSIDEGKGNVGELVRRFLNDSGETTQFALVEVDFQVPIISMNSLFVRNNTLEIVRNLKISNKTTEMRFTFSETPKLKQIPDPFVIPSNVKTVAQLFHYTGPGLAVIRNFTIEDADMVSMVMDGCEATSIEDWKINTKDTSRLFGNVKIERMNRIYIKCNGLRDMSSFSNKHTFRSIKQMVVETEAESFSMENSFGGHPNLTELDLTFKATDKLKTLDLSGAFTSTGLLSSPTNFKIPESVTRLKAGYLFAYCPNLTSISSDFKIPEAALNSEENIYLSDTSSMFWNCPQLETLPEGFGVSLSTQVFMDCKNLTSLPEGFRIGNMEKLDYYKEMQTWGPYPLPMFGINGDQPGQYIKPTIALPLKVDKSLKKYQELGEVNFTQKLFFEGLPQNIQIDALDMFVGTTYLDETNGLKEQLENIKINLESKGYKDISFILKPYEETNPITENYAKFRSLSTRDVGAVDSANSGKSLTDFITELGAQKMDCDPKVIEVKYSGGVVASTPELTVTPVYTDTNVPYDQTEWTKDNITVNIVAKDDVTGIDKIVITDPNGNPNSVSNENGGNELTYGHQISVTDMTTSGEYTYKYQTVNTQGSLSDEKSVTIRVDIDKPQASIENGILKATDEHSGVKEIKLPDGTIISWTDDYGNNGYEVSEYGTYEIYDNAGNVTEVIYKATAVTEPAITLAYEKEWTNKDVMVEVTITNADEVALLELPDGTTRVLGDEKTVTTTYLVQEEGEKDYRFAITKKAKAEGNLVETAHIKLDKTAPTASIVTVNGKNYLKASDTLSGVSHLISPSGNKIMWLPEYEQNGYQIAEDGTYQVYDRAGNNGEQSGTQIKEEVTPIAPIPTIPSFPEENKTEPETDKKTEDKKEPETDKKTEDKKESKPDKKTEDKKETKPDKKTEDKKESKPDKKTEDKTTDKQSKEDSTLEYSKTPETPTDVEIKLLTPDGKIETIYIPEEKVYLLESGETIFGRDIGYPFIDRIYYGGKGRPIIVGLNGEEYQCLNVTPVSETVMSDSKHGTLVGTSNTTSPKTGDNIIQVVLLFALSGVLVAEVSIRNRRKTMK